MRRNWKKKLGNYEYLRIKKIGNFYYAYARVSSYGGQKERYLGRCDQNGNVILKRRQRRSKLQ